MYDNDLLNKILGDKKIEGSDRLFRETSLETFQQLEYPAWHRLRVKDTSFPDYKPYNNQKVLYHKQVGLSVTPLPLQPEEVTVAVGGKAYGAGDKHRRLTEAFANAGTYVEVAEDTSVEEPVILQMALNRENPLLLDRHTIKVGRGSSVTLVIDYSDDGSKVYHSGLLNIIADENARVHVLKIQAFSSNCTHIFGGLSILERDAFVKFNSIDLGGALVVTDYSTYLTDENSEGVVDSIYLGEGKTKLDLAYNIYHKGRRSKSDVTVKGALLDESRKVFRGNLFFAKGAKRAKGSEEEFVILLDKRVRADSIPALMCDEDDVQGEHAASAGQVDASKLFYLMSRGLAEKEAKQLIIMASFAPVIEQLPIEGLKERIHMIVGDKLTEDL